MESEFEVLMLINKSLIIINQTENTIMNTKSMADLMKIDDPKVREIANRVVRETELELYKVIAHSVEPTNFPLPQDPHSVEQMLYKHFSRLTPTQKQRAVEKAPHRFGSSQAQWEAHFGDLSKIDLRSPIPVVQQAGDFALTTQLSVPSVTFPVMTGLASSDLRPLSRVKRLKLLLHQFKCLDETNTRLLPWGTTEGGVDDMYLGATSVDEIGKTAQLTEIYLGEYEDGDVNPFPPSYSYTSFDLRNGTEYPKRYFVVLALAEKDFGDFPEFLNTLLVTLSAKVKEYISKYLAGAGPYGPIISFAINGVIPVINDWIKELWEDEIFTPVPVSVQIDSPTHRFDGGKTDSPEAIARFEGHGGRFEITYSWRLMLAGHDIGTSQSVS